MSQANKDGLSLNYMQVGSIISSALSYSGNEALNNVTAKPWHMNLEVSSN
jgi:hypothetical protein